MAKLVTSTPTFHDLYLFQLLYQLLEGQRSLSKQMADLATDLANLASVVTSLSADVQAVLTKLATAPNITPDQQAQLEAQIDALQQLDNAVKAATTS